MSLLQVMSDYQTEGPPFVGMVNARLKNGAGMVTVTAQ